LHENVLAPDAAVYHGTDGLKKWFEASFEAFPDFSFEPRQFIKGTGCSPRSRRPLGVGVVAAGPAHGGPMTSGGR
jgi:hypothetical protein